MFLASDEQLRTDTDSSRKWISIDNSQPFPPTMFSTTSGRCSSLPSSYKRYKAVPPGETTSKRSVIHGNSARGILDVESLTPLSLMQYDELSQVSNQLVQQSTAVSREFIDKSESQTCVDTSVYNKSTAVVSPVSSDQYLNHSQYKTNNPSDNTNHIDFIEHSDGTFSPQWDDLIEQ